MSTATYTAKDIGVLEGLEPVRKRPSMYIGGVDAKGLHHLVWEIVDNAVDEYLNGFADAITVTLHKNGDAVTVSDNGRGIPVDLHPKYKRPALELILTTLHSGAKFGDGEVYFHSGGLHGVGSSVVNALSRKLIATIHRDGFEWQQTFRRGKPITELEKRGPSRGHGTTIYFEPDPEIFKTTQFDSKWIREHLESMSYIHSGLKITFKDEIAKETYDLTHVGGIPEFLQRLVAEGQKPAVTETPFTLVRNNGERMEVALQWTESTDEVIRSYVNGIRTSAGGTHEAGLKSGIAKAIRNYMETHEVKVKGLTITAEDIREGIVAILSVFVREPMFQGQTKEKLNNPEMAAAVDSWIRPALESWLNANRTAADQIVGRIVLAAKARLASREAASEVKRKSATQRRLNLPGKLADCKSTSLDESELFLVEGDSAGGSAKQGRNNKTQAVLPLRGKILNVASASTEKLRQNQELRDLVEALGCGVGERAEIARLRYGRVIIMTDADVDGAHIASLLMTFFYRELPELIRAGHLYLAQPPLYRLTQGAKTVYAMDDRDRDRKLRSAFKASARVEVSRFKGLGEMPPADLKSTTMDPAHRTLLKVVAAAADRAQTSDLVENLMGRRPEMRFQFIQEHARTVELIDV